MENRVHLWQQALAIWSSGGWGMVALSVDAVIIFYLGLAVFFRIRSKGYLYVSEKKMKRWIKKPKAGAAQWGG